MRQIDYIIIGAKDKWKLQNVDTEDDFYIGNDHRIGTATLKIKSKQSKNRKTARNTEIRANLKSW